MECLTPLPMATVNFIPLGLAASIPEDGDCDSTSTLARLLLLLMFGLSAMSSVAAEERAYAVRALPLSSTIRGSLAVVMG